MEFNSKKKIKFSRKLTKNRSENKQEKMRAIKKVSEESKRDEEDSYS